MKSIVVECRGIVFDLDGVLADSGAAVDASWETWSERHGIDPQTAIRNGHGRTTIEAIRVTAPALDAHSSFEEMEALEASFIDRVSAIRGAARFVQRLEELGVPWGVATSGTARIALPRLARAGVPNPRVLITADDVKRGKPDPEPYLLACKALGLLPQTCIVFEDAPAGVESARRAGARVVAVGEDRIDGADAAIADFTRAFVDVAQHEKALARVTLSR